MSFSDEIEDKDFYQILREQEESRPWPSKAAISAYYEEETPNPNELVVDAETIDEIFGTLNFEDK